jgi:flagellar biosynthesis/type III secretory pathway ATPase
LSRRLAEQAHWPAIDVLSSISRSMNDIVDGQHRDAAANVKRLLAAYRQSEDLISIGAYQPGSNRQVDLAIRMKQRIDDHLQQSASDHVDFAQAAQSLMNLERLSAGMQLSPAPSSARTTEQKPTDGEITQH